jgi:hypothetical protein
MGQLCAKDSDDKSVAKKSPAATAAPPPARTTKYSYQLISVPQKAKYEASKDPADYACNGLKGQTWVRLPGQVNDQRINIEKVSDCTFVLMDHCDSVQIDDAVNCSFFIGPTSGSVFIRSSTNCRFAIACGQLRLRDVHKSEFSLLCRSRPAIESSDGIAIGCFTRPQYVELRSQMAKAGLSAWTNLWYIVHDFTPKPGNWRAMTAAESASVFPSLAPYCGGEVTAEEEAVARVLPLVTGRTGVSNTLTLVAHPGRFEDVDGFFLSDAGEGRNVEIVQSREVKLSADEVAILTSAGKPRCAFVAGHVVIVVVVALDGTNPSSATVADQPWVAICEDNRTASVIRDLLLGAAGTESGFGHALA